VLTHEHDGGQDYERFIEACMTHEASIRRYCQIKTGSSWDAEDLLQDTLVKAFRWHTQHPDREITRTFLFRIAANAWIDLCRKRNRSVQAYELDEQVLVSYTDWHVSDVREALELLADHLEPRQVVLVLLHDVFGFTASETASMFALSEGAVKAALHRARQRLKQAADRHPESWGESQTAVVRRGLPIEVFESFVAAFRRADPAAIVESYKTMVAAGAQLDSLSFRGSILYFTFRDPDGNTLMITGRAKNDNKP
jgi:RNA polymerase sigma factor (sigma-70 family)